MSERDTQETEAKIIMSVWMDGGNQLCIGWEDYWTEIKTTASSSVSTNESVISSEEKAEKKT